MTTTKWDYDVIIVGAGVAGSGSAILLGQEGHRVLLVDRAVFPRHKTCGEGIMPEGVRVLESLGVLPSVLDQGAGLARGLRFRSQAGVWAQADFPPVADEPAYSVVIRRYELDHLLLQRARSLPNVTVREGFAMVEALYEGGAIQGSVRAKHDSSETGHNRVQTGTGFDRFLRQLVRVHDGRAEIGEHRRDRGFSGSNPPRQAHDPSPRLLEIPQCGANLEPAANAVKPSRARRPPGRSE